MPNMSLTKVPMPEQDPNVRNKNFEEVALGYTKEMAMEEATRCLNCKKPFCMDGCPVGVPIPEFIHHVAEGEFEEAYQTITRENALPAICGRVCPQENQCEGKCVRGIKTESVGIGRLERFVADYHREHGKPAELKIEKNGKKVAVIGSGPAGITCAGELAKKGYDVTVFEALHKTGGVLSYGIPEFRLPKKLVQSEVDGVAALGVDFETNVVVGRSITIDELQERGICPQSKQKSADSDYVRPFYRPDGHRSVYPDHDPRTAASHALHTPVLFCSPGRIYPGREARQPERGDLSSPGALRRAHLCLRRRPLLSAAAHLWLSPRLPVHGRDRGLADGTVSPQAHFFLSGRLHGGLCGVVPVR